MVGVMGVAAGSARIHTKKRFSWSKRMEKIGRRNSTNGRSQSSDDDTITGDPENLTDKDTLRRKSDVSPPSVKEQLWEFFDAPESSRCAGIFGNFMMVLILISLLTLVLEPDPNLRDVPKAFWVYLDMVIVIFFTGEFSGRFWAVPDRGKFMKDFMNWADLLSILPFFMDLVVNQGIDLCCDDPADEVSGGGGGSLMRGLRTIRLFRILRIMKVGRYNTEFGTFIKTLSKSAGAVRILILLMMLQILIFSVLVYDIEHESNPDMFPSIPAAMWWAVVTSCTVGYGDMYPVTSTGKLLGATSMLTGMVVMSLPLSIIGANCVREYLNLQEEKMKNYTREIHKRQIEEEQRLMREQDVMEGSMLGRVRTECYRATEGEGKFGKVVLGTVCIAIAASIFGIVFQSMPELDVDDSVWDTVELVCVLVFTVEILLRVTCCPSFLHEYIWDPLNWIDFLATAPFYIELIWSQADMDFFKVLRALRVVRLLKIFRHDAGIGVLLETLSQSGSAVLMLIGVVGANLLFFSVAVFEFERGDWDQSLRNGTGAYINIDGKESAFQSVVAGFYWTIETVTTVGYGDIQPLTTYGKIVGGLCCVIGVLSITLPITIIGVNFCAAYDKHAMDEFDVEQSGELEANRDVEVLKRLRQTLCLYRGDLTHKYGDILSEIPGHNIVLRDEVHELLERLPPKAGIHGGKMHDKANDLIGSVEPEYSLEEGDQTVAEEQLGTKGTDLSAPAKLQ